MRKASRASQVTAKTYTGLMLVTLATLMLQILLTRVFSVTLWYHFAFMAVSIAMFGLTLGAVIVYLHPRAFAPELAKRQLAGSSLGFAVSIAVCFVLHLFVPYLTGTGAIAPDPTGDGTHSLLATIAYLGLTYVVISIPFVFSGIAVCLALTRFPSRVNRLYAADLAGAALGCVALLWLMRFADGPSAVIVVAAIASIGALLLALDAGSRARHVIVASLVAALLLGSTSVFLAARADRGAPLLRLLWVKGKRAPKPLFEKWNSFAYLRVGGNPNAVSPPIGWGLSEKTVGQPLRQLAITIDAAAGTVMTNFDGDIAKLRHLEFDVTNLAHHLRRNARVLVAGTGGGRDILSALYFRQASVVGVEINGDLVKTINGPFGEFTGHLDRNPRVVFVTDEVRSFVTRQRDSFDIIQVSLIDTWAATAAGAFVLTENALYTVEAWETFLEHLTPTGLLTFSRWHDPKQPSETYRLTALATGALLKMGVDDPRRHIAVVTNLAPDSSRKTGICTLLASRSPLSLEDLSRLSERTEEMRFSVLVSPDAASDPVLEEIVASRDLGAYAQGFPLDISPPTDDRPFFFNMLRLRDALRTGDGAISSNDSNLRAVRVLGSLLVIVLALSAAFLLLPLLWTRESMPARVAPWLLYFGAIGLGFMFVEISLIQRLIIFLGHPTYGLSVLLFSLLLSGGVGSLLTPRIHGEAQARRAAWRLAALLGVLAIFDAATPVATEAFRGEATPVRIAVAVVAVLPLGVLMGSAFPLGMGLASLRFDRLTPWFWGVNGAASVCASVVAVIVALSGGISRAFWVGTACYAVALIAFWFSSMESRIDRPS